MRPLGLLMKQRIFLVLAICLSFQTYALQRVDNFALLDQHGEFHELSYYKDQEAIVLFVQGNGCPIVRNVLNDFKTVRDQFDGEQVKFMMINSNLQDSREDIAAESLEWNIDFDILIDETQLVGESLELTRTAEVLVIDPNSWQLAYRGPINDRVTYEKQKVKAENHYLRDALNAMISGKAVGVASAEPRGCLINFANKDKAHAQISYSETIAPMLKDKCVACHQKGGIAPWAMSDYRMIKGFSPMIREVVRTRRMPPWHADPHVGEWADDRSLSIEQKQTLVHWIEAGSPKSAGEPDPLAAYAAQAEAWPLGEPDLIITAPSYDIPASGVIDYEFPVVKNPLDRDVWVKAITISPSNTAVTHHVLVGTSNPGKVPDNDSDNLFENYLGGYAPGTESTLMPEGTGVFVPKGSYFLFQMHYTPYGKAASDQTQLALYFHDEKPENYLRYDVVLNPLIRIPANDDRHEESAYFTFHHDAILYTVLPHSHYRGWSSTFSLVHPNGDEETILSVPRYDFNWQRGYDFKDPRFVAAGTKLVHKTIYDNSTRNPANPDPERDVPWGLQSHDEMLYGDFVYRWVEESTDNPIHNYELQETTQMFGFMDRNMNGSLEKSELSKRWLRRLEAGFKHFDKDGTPGLSIREFLAMESHRQSNQAGGGEE